MTSKRSQSQATVSSLPTTISMFQDGVYPESLRDPEAYSLVLDLDEPRWFLKWNSVRCPADFWKKRRVVGRGKIAKGKRALKIWETADIDRKLWCITLNMMAWAAMRLGRINWRMWYVRLQAFFQRLNIRDIDLLAHWSFVFSLLDWPKTSKLSCCEARDARIPATWSPYGKAKIGGIHNMTIHNYIPGPPKECLLVGFMYLKTFIKHTFGGPGIFF